MSALAVNVVIAAIWLFLSRDRSLADLAVGFGAGFGLLALFGAVMGNSSFARRGIAAARFAIAFAGQFVLANLSVAVVVLTGRKAALRPNFVTYDVTGLTPREILILSYCITLTPGTTTVDISEDWKTLTLHALDARDPARLRAQIDRSLKEPLMRATR